MERKNFLRKAIEELIPNESFIIVNGVIKFKNTQIKQPTKEQIQDKIAELEAREKLNNAYTSLQKLCDTKSQEAKNYIAGKKVTDEQLARYKEKLEIAQEYKTNGSYADVLKLEADLKGITVDELADLIITKGNEYKQKLIEFNAKIEAFRVKVSKMIEDGEIDKANKIIEKARSFGADTTDDDIKALFDDNEQE